MTARKKVSSEELERRLLADAHKPGAWEPITTVAASQSQRPAWYGLTARREQVNKIRALKSASRTTEVVDIAEARAKRKARTRSVVDDQKRESDALRRKQVHDAIAALPPGQRQCLQLWMDGFAYSEISAALHISLDAVKSRLRDAKRHLRSRLGEQNDDEGGDRGLMDRNQSPRTG
jgi:RNA polymerase sigma factor (sigma-70 family)